MKKLLIALDCDGLLCNFAAGILRLVEEVTGKRFELSDMTGFDFAESLGLARHEERAVEKIISSRRGFVASLAPYPHARQGVRRLRELGDIICVTSPWDSNPWWCEERDAWLALHFGIDVVHHADDKSVHEADVFVDDRSKHVRAWILAWPGRCAVLWRTLHNTGESVPWGAWSISTWDALYEVARDYAKGPVQRPLPMTEGIP